MFRIFTLFFILTYTLFGCNLCKIDIPNVHIKSKITLQKDKMIFDINWDFDSKFIASLVQYDTNNNQKFEPNEQTEIKKSLVEYVEKLNFLTQIALVKKDTKVTKELLQNIKNATYNFIFLNNNMGFNYRFSLPILPTDNHKLILNFYDEGNNFNFIIKDVVLENFQKKQKQKIGKNKAEIFFYDPLDDIKTKLETKTVEAREKTILDELSGLLEFYKTKLESLIKEIKDTNSVIAYLWLFFFSFVYGVLHAIGPGHGKSLVGAYFLSENHSVKKALGISFMIGVVHTLSAFILTFSIYFILNLLFSSLFNNIEMIATKVSGAIIIFMASYLIYKKYTYKEKIVFSANKPIAESKVLQSSCGCNSCTNNSTDLGVVLGAGIIPCAGTVTVFLFTISLGVYLVGFLSAIFMSLGMSLVIFLTAYLSIKIQTKGSSNRKVLKLFEYGSLIFILFLGSILLF